MFANSPTLVTPALGTPSSGTLTSCTGLPVATGISGLGTGIATALAVNVGTAGSPVVNGGALGTPSSGTVTNLTGTASININGTVGATTPAAGTFTTLTSTGNSSLGDAEASDTHAIKGATTLLANSASAALTVTQTGSGNAFVVEDSASTDSTPFVIDASGNVVIGYTATRNIANPISGAAMAPIFEVVGSAATATPAIVRVDTSGSSPSAVFAKARGSIGSESVVSSGDGTGRISFQGHDGTNFIPNVIISAEVDGTPGTNDMPGRLVFSTTADGASSPTERMRIDSAGNVGIGIAPSAGVSLHNSKNITGSTSAFAYYTGSTILSDVTINARGYATFVGTQAAAFTLGNLWHLEAAQSTFGAGSAVTNQYGFTAQSSLTGATNNYGFYANIAAAANRWNFYANGTADNYFAGKVGIGAVPAAAYGALRIASSHTGATTVSGVVHEGGIASDVTVAANYFATYAATSATSFTLSILRHFHAQQGTIGAGSTVTNQFGYSAESTLTGATNNYGFYSNIAAAANRWNFYAAGSAPNYFAGDTTVAGTLTANGQTVGYLNIPQNSQSAPYTLVLGDAGKHILHPSADTTARTITIPANSSVAFPIGTAVTFVNQASAGVMTIAITTDTMRLAGAGTTGSRTLAANGVATAIKLTSTEWIISGTNLT